MDYSNGCGELSNEKPRHSGDIAKTHGAVFTQKGDIAKIMELNEEMVCRCWSDFSERMLNETLANRIVTTTTIMQNATSETNYISNRILHCLSLNFVSLDLSDLLGGMVVS